MSQYTTGELAKACGVSVRTVQYYDSRDILIPSELSDGGRRIYSEDDLKKLQLICFLREVGISIKTIGEIFEEKNSAKVIACILKEHEQYLKKEIDEKQAKLDVLTALRRSVSKDGDFSLEKINDVATSMESKKKLKKVRCTIIYVGVALGLIEIAAIVLWAVCGLWIAFAVGMPIVIALAVWISYYYFKSVNYVCPECGAIFKPKFKNAFFAMHTPTTRKLTCPKCGKKSYCIETAKDKTV